jgi:hypothetical protein
VRKKRPLLWSSITIAIAACLAGPADAATITLWDFDGISDPSTSILTEGNYYVDDGSFGIGPYQGSNQGILQTVGGSLEGTIESNLGLGSNDIRQLFNTHVRRPGYSTSQPLDVESGSAFQISFTAEAGDVFAFDWNMLTDEFGRTPANPAAYTDFAWYQLTGADSAEGSLANVNDGGFSALGATAYDHHKGQQTTELTLTTGGSYTLTVGINDVLDTNNNFASVLVLDYFRLLRMPEPGTFATVAGGLAALSWLSRRRSR